MDKDSFQLITKLIATIIVWIAFAALGANVAGQPEPFNFLMMLFTTATIISTTFFIWGGVNILSGVSGDDMQESKRKRSPQDLDSAMMLLQLLSDEERTALKRRLVNSLQNEDGELSPGIYEEDQQKSSYR